LKDGMEHDHIGKIYSYSKTSQSCNLVSVTCKYCEAKHFYSYVIFNKITKRFYENCLELDYISFTQETVFEILLLKSVTVDLVHKHASFTSICSSLNSLMDNTKEVTRGKLIDKRLIENWFYFNLCSFYLEYSGNFKSFDAPLVEDLDSSIKKAREYLFPHFVKIWTGDQHRSICTHPSCSLAINIDGNHKCNRLTCMYDEYIFESPEITGILSLNCKTKNKQVF
jgi:hypothetical protein